MKRFLQNEKGYTLILTLFVILLFTVVGATLMAATIGGAQKNKIRETDIQATELANNGVEYLTAQINTELENGLGTTGLLRNDFINLLETTLNKYKTEVNRISKNSDTGDYSVYITDIKDTLDKDGTPNPLRKKVTFISKGKANNNQKQVTSEIEIGAQSVLETLKYAVGANKCKDNPNTLINECKNRLPGEGNLFLHGGVTIQGDMKVDGDIITTDRGYATFRSVGAKWIESQYPTILPTQGAADPHLILGGNVYTFTHKPAYDDHIGSSSFGAGYTKLNNINDGFYNNNAPIKVDRELTPDEIEISDNKSVFEYGETEPGVIQIKNETVISGKNYKKDQKVIASRKDCYWWICSYQDFTFNGDNNFGSFATTGSLSVRNTGTDFKKTVFSTGAYIEQDLTIGNTTTTSENPINYEKIRMDGPVFVNGNVTIKGANAEFNSIMYVMGNVTIEYSVLNGLVDQAGKNGSLIIFAKGNIKIANNSLNQDTPSNIKGFFYTEQALEMFGVGSNIKIDGGLSANRIVLNAIRGRARDNTKDKTFTGYQTITSTDYFEGKENQKNWPSRLQVIYNRNIMETYADIKSREPIVKSVDPPQLINRE